MYLLCNYRGALRAPTLVHGKIHTAEAAAAEAGASELATSRACHIDTPLGGVLIIKGGYVY